MREGSPFSSTGSSLCVGFDFAPADDGQTDPPGVVSCLRLREKHRSCSFSKVTVTSLCPVDISFCLSLGVFLFRCFNYNKEKDRVHTVECQQLLMQFLICTVKFNKNKTITKQ